MTTPATSDIPEAKPRGPPHPDRTTKSCWVWTTLETLVPIAELEQKRGRPLDQGSVKLLARHYSEWSSLFPYFERLTELSQDDFEALERFAATVERVPGRHRRMPCWGSGMRWWN